MAFLFENAPIRDINGEFVYEFLFGQIPSVYTFEDIDVSIAYKYLIDNGYELITQAISDHDEGLAADPMVHVFAPETLHGDSEHNIFFFKKQNVLIRLTQFGKNGYIGLYSQDIVLLKKVVPEFQAFVKKKTKNSEIGVLVSTNGHIIIKKVPLDVTDLDVTTNYGSEFAKTKHELIVKKMTEERSGLYLFYGEAGTGKTNYIKYLSKLVDRDFIFVPTNMIDSLVSPDLIQTLINHENLVLILEDAEKAVVNREQNKNEALVSTILNLTDGLIGNLFNVTIIVTFNTAKERIDKALYRKGRLKIEHDFKPLTEADSQNLVNKLGKKFTVKKPMTLAEIYNVEEDNFHKDAEKKIAYPSGIV
jgi:hypothetical protein